MNNQTVTVVDRYRDTEMIRYIEHPDGAKTVLERTTYDARPFVKFVEPIPFPKEYVDYLCAQYERAQRITGQQNTNGLN